MPQVQDSSRSSYMKHDVELHNVMNKYNIFSFLLKISI